MFKLVIDKEKWLRGDNKESMLLRPRDGLMCCLGFRCLALGYSPTEITEQSTLESVATDYEDVRVDWMKGGFGDSVTVETMVAVNDDPTLTDEERISKLQELALSVGEEWVFV